MPDPLGGSGSVLGAYDTATRAQSGLARTRTPSRLSRLSVIGNGLQIGEGYGLVNSAALVGIHRPECRQ